MKKTEKNDLYDYATERDISVLNVELPNNKSVSAMSKSGKCYIGLDPLEMKTKAEENVHLAHELGHCETGSFYNRYSPCDIRGKHEQTANRWAVKKLVPKTELVRLLKKGFARWELAESFEVTEDFINLAIRMYFEYGIT